MTNKEKIEVLKKIYVNGCSGRRCSMCPFYDEAAIIGFPCLFRELDERTGLFMTDEKRKLIVSILNDLDDEYQYRFNPFVPEKLSVAVRDSYDAEIMAMIPGLYSTYDKDTPAATKDTNKLVYIASPYTKGDNFVNTQRQITTAIELLKQPGIVPFCPLLNSVFVNMQHEFSYDKWLEVDFTYLSKCDYLLRLSGESSGADKEVAYAKEHGIPVFYDIDSLIMAIKGGKVD